MLFYEIHKIKFWPIADSSHTYLYIIWHSWIADIMCLILKIMREKNPNLSKIYGWKLQSSTQTPTSTQFVAEIALSYLPPGGGGGAISAVLRLRKNADFFWLFTLHALIYLMKILSLKYGFFDDFQPPPLFLELELE